MEYPTTQDRQDPSIPLPSLVHWEGVLLFPTWSPVIGANILIDAAGNAKLADFGACMQLEVWGGEMDDMDDGWPL